MAPNTSQIGAWLRAARERQAEFTQEQAAHRLGVTERSVRKWEKGVNAPPADKFLALVALYGADVRTLPLREISPATEDGHRVRSANAKGKR